MVGFKWLNLLRESWKPAKVVEFAWLRRSTVATKKREIIFVKQNPLFLTEKLLLVVLFNYFHREYIYIW